MTTETTDIVGYSLPFTKASCPSVSFSGMPSIWAPLRSIRQIKDLAGMIMNLEKQAIEIKDARKLGLTYTTSGFDLKSMKSEITDWDNEEQLSNYKKEVEDHLRVLHPKVKRFFWMDFLKRGGPTGNPPAVDGPHLDYFQDWSKCNAFAGRGATEASDIPSIVLGVWRPVMMKKPIYDFPLVYMDKRDYNDEVAVPFYQHFTHMTPQGCESCKNLASHIKYDQGQRWYYHSDMKTDECVIFTHYSHDGSGANVHCAVKRPVEEGKGEYDTRRSIENRVMLFF